MIRFTALLFASAVILSLQACGTVEGDPDPQDGDSDHTDADAPSDDDGPLDTTAPAAPTLTSTSPTSPSATVVNPTVNGTAEAGSLVRIYRTADCTGSLAAYGPTGATGFELATIGGIANTATTFTATATDAAGNTSSCSSALTYEHDGLAPGEPSLTGTSPASPNQDLTPLVQGTIASDALITIYTGGDCSGTPVASGRSSAGLFAFEVTVTADTTTTFRATGTDDLGNVSACSIGITYRHDGTEPTPPTFSGVSPASPSNIATSPSIAGNVEAGALVTLYTTSDCSGTALASESSVGTTFSVDVDVAANTTTTFFATATDAAGNVSACSASGIVYVHDDLPPSAPSNLVTAPSSPSNDATPDVSGDLPADAIAVAIYDNAACTGTPLATSAATSAFSLTVSITADTTFYAAATDLAGNPSACSSGIAYTLDTAAPAPPVLVVSPSSPAADLDPEVSGTAEPAATITLYGATDCGGSSIGTFTTSAGGTFGPDDFLVGANTSSVFSATATDTAGNTSSCSADVVYLNDGLAPDAPVFSATEPPSPANDTLDPLLEGDAELGSLVQIYITNDCTGLVVATGAGGTFSIEVPATANTTTTYYATATDAAANVSPCSAGISFTHDDIGPAPPTGLATDPVSPSNDATPLVSGNLAVDAVAVAVYDNPTCTGTPLASDDASGSFSLAVSIAADTTFYASATDVAGNPSACSTGVAYVYDTVPPNAPVMAVSPSSPSTSNALTLSGTAEALSTLALYATSGCSGSAFTTFAVFANGTFGPYPDLVSDNFTVTYSARATDAAGNPSLCSNDVVFQNDKTPPPVPVMTGSSPASPSQEDEPTIQGSAQAGSLVRLYRDTATPCDTDTGQSMTVGIGGTFGFAVTVTTTSTTTFRARSEDALGNISACSSTAVVYVNDVAAPAAPTIAITPVGPSTSTRPSVSGTAEAGATVRLFTTSDCSGGSGAQVIATGGAFSFEASVLPDSTVTFTVDAVDPAGNISPCSTAITYVNELIAAGEVLVALDAAHSTAGTALWSNAGTIGAFARVGGPTVGTVGGLRAVSFNGTATVDAYQSPNAAPAGLVGVDATRSVEAWVRNAVTVEPEETIVAWGHRAGPAGSNSAFGYGTSSTTGALDYNGTGSRPWNGGVPQQDTWHHLAYTYDGTTTRLYRDGVLVLVDVLGAGVVSPAGGTKITLAAQLADAAGTLPAPRRGILAIGRLRIHDGVLSDSDIADNYFVEGHEMFPANECTPGRCSNGGVCTDGVNSFTCACTPGWTGTTCATSINDCSPNPCANGGACIDGHMSFTCSCPSGFVGPTCTGSCAACVYGETCTDNGTASAACVGQGMAPTNACAATTCGPTSLIQDIGQMSANQCKDMCLNRADCGFAVVYYAGNPNFGHCNLYNFNCVPCQGSVAATNVKFIKVP